MNLVSRSRPAATAVGRAEECERLPGPSRSFERVHYQIWKRRALCAAKPGKQAGRQAGHTWSGVLLRSGEGRARSFANRFLPKPKLGLEWRWRRGADARMHWGDWRGGPIWTSANVTSKSRQKARSERTRAQRSPPAGSKCLAGPSPSVPPPSPCLPWARGEEEIWKQSRRD